MTEEDLLVSVIILGYNGRRYLDDCLSSILDQELSAISYEVIYADNGSSDDSIEFVQERYPQVRCLAFGENLGFAEGNNRAVEHASGHYILLMNQDMIVHRRLLSAMLNALTADAQLAACHASQILPFHDDFAAQERTNLLDSVYVPEINRYGFVEFRQIAMQISPIHTRFLSGACFMIDTHLLKQLRYLFDTQFFMYAEDLDLALRIRALGHTIAVVPQAVVYHLHYYYSGSKWGMRAVRAAYLDTRNRILAFYKTTPPNRFLRQLPRLIIGAPAKVFHLGTNRLIQIFTFLGMIPVVLIATLASFTMMRRYTEERKYWLQNRSQKKAPLYQLEEL